jgi:hypothetical protein
MRHIFLGVFLIMTQGVHAQYVYTIKADSVKITNCDSAELIIENHTQGIPGFLFNTGNGRTIFKRGFQTLNDSQYVIGADTFNLSAGLSHLINANNGLSVSGRNIVLGNDLGDTAATLRSNRYIPAAGNTIFLTNPAAGTQNALSAAGMTATVGSIRTIVSAGIVNVRQSLTNSTGAGGFINMNGTLDYLNNTSNQTLSTGSATFGCNYTLHGTNPDANITSSSFAISDNFTPSGAGNFGYNSITINPFYNFSSYSAADNTFRDVKGIYYNPFVLGTIPSRHVAYENTNGDNIFNSGASGHTANMGRSGFHNVPSPTAYVEIGAGTGDAGTAPLKLTSGTILSTPEAGAIEYDGTDLYLTNNTARYKLERVLTGQLSTNFGGPSLAAGSAVTTTLAIAGVQAGDVVSVNSNSGSVNPPSIFITAYATTSGTVSLRAYNAGSSAVTLASDTYNIRVIK